MSNTTIRIFATCITLLITSSCFSQLKQRNSRLELMSASHFAIHNWGIISGGPNLCFARKISKQLELGAYGGLTYSLQTPRYRILYRVNDGNNYVDQVSEQIEFGLFSNIYLNKLTGSIAPIGTHICLGFAYGSMKIDQIYRKSEQNKNFVAIRDNQRINRLNSTHLKMLIGLGKTTQFSNHFTFRSMVAITPHVLIEETDSGVEFWKIDRNAGFIEKPIKASPYSYFNVQFALGYQF